MRPNGIKRGRKMGFRQPGRQSQAGHITALRASDERRAGACNAFLRRTLENYIFLNILTIISSGIRRRYNCSALPNLRRDTHASLRLV